MSAHSPRSGDRVPARVRPALLVAAVLIVLVARPLLALGRTAAPSTLAGVLQATPASFAAEHADGVRLVTLDLSWAAAEPGRGHFSSAYAAGMERQIAAARRDELEVSLDLGLQYAPAWVFRLNGGTRFVDQYGDVFDGTEPSGNDVANAVTDPAVRSAEAAYLRWAGRRFRRPQVASVREGGGPDGELRYPLPDYDGHTDCWWAYDASSQREQALRWRPGTGTTEQAGRFLAAYNADLVSYGVWLDDQVATDFAAPERLLLLPGWGQRPGVAAGVIASRLEQSDPEFNEGLDWTALVNALRPRVDTVLYTTYLDAPEIGSSLQLRDPLDFLVYLDRGRPFRLGGENTGGGTVATMRLVLQRAAGHHLAVVNWMDQQQLVNDQRSPSPNAPTLAAYRQLIARYLGRAG